MKSLRIVSGLMLMGLLLGLSLPVSGFVPGVEQKAVVAETSQGDTVRMRWYIGSDWVKSFYFYGEEDATYQVEWGDGTTNTYTGQGPKSAVECKHSYGGWVECYRRVLLYGVGTVE